MIATVVRGAAALVLALVPAAAGARAVRAPVILTAAPARLMLAGSARGSVRVTNSGARRVVVDVSRAPFALDLRGRPRIVPSPGLPSAARWLTLRPSRFALGPRSSVSLLVASRLPRRPEPGDHDAVVLLSTHPVATARVGVRVRLGVVVVVRAPGRVVRRLELRGLSVARRRRGRVLEVVVANRGNVTESVVGARAVVSRARTGRRVTALAARPGDVRPRTIGLLEFPFRGRFRGRMTLNVVIPGDAGRGALRRTYRLRL